MPQVATALQRRKRGTDCPWEYTCWGSGAVAAALLLGFYLLLAPCLPPALTVAFTLLHVLGVACYAWLLRHDPIGVVIPTTGAGLRWCRRCTAFVTDARRTKHCHT